MTKAHNPVSIISIYQQVKSMLSYHEHNYGFLVLFVVIFTLSIFAGIPEKKTSKFFIEGEIANSDVIANRDIMIEDEVATFQKRQQVRQLHPIVFDLEVSESRKSKESILLLLQTIDKTIADKDQERLGAIIDDFNTSHNLNLNNNTFLAFISDESKTYINNILLPWLELTYLTGVLPSANLLHKDQVSMLIRNSENNSEIIRSVNSGILDLESLIIVLENKITAEQYFSIETKNALLAIIPKLILANLSLNQELTDKRIQNILTSIEPVFHNINKGEVLVRAGDKVDRLTQLKLQALFGNSFTEFNILKSLGVLLLGLVCVFGLYMSPSGVKGRILKDKDQLFIAIVLLFVGICAVLLSYYSSNKAILAYAFPISGVSGLAVLIFSARRYCVLGLLLSLYSTVLFAAPAGLFFFYFFSAMFSTWLILKTQSRQDVLRSTFPLFIFQLVVGYATALISDFSTGQLCVIILMIAINSMLSSLVLFALSPVLELLFGYTTRFRLMELLSLDHPLLQELMTNVPGTYHHSLIVSNLVESGAKAIGAYSLLAKVGALYHDIGKLTRSIYFSENQFNCKNPHDKLSPTMSCLILFSHVKNGAELASKYKLGDEITDMILQHHGTRMPMVFFHKAVQLGENPSEAEYRYPGPKPQTKEAAILMMADTVEAAIRSMGDPSPARIRNSVETLIKNIYAEGQFDETDLTFKDLTKLIESFTRTLTGVYHQRTAYPDLKKVDKDEECSTKNSNPYNTEAKPSQENEINNALLKDHEMPEIEPICKEMNTSDTESTNMQYAKRNLAKNTE